MPHPLQMPALSPTMTEGTLVRWLKAEGDAFRAGDVLAEVETDKATMELEAAEDGVLGKILTPEGAEAVAVGAALALLLDEGEDASALEAASAEVAPAPESAPASVAPPASAPASAAPASAPPESAPAPVSAPPAMPAVSVAPVASASPAVPVAPEREWEGETETLAVRDALRDAMAEEMRRDKRVFLLGEEVADYQGPYKVSVNLVQEFGPRRVIDTPITEHGFAGLGIGAAFYGLRPIVEFMTFNFAMQALDQIINSAAKTHYMSNGRVSTPIVFRGPNGAAARVAAQHSQCYAGWYAHVPGLVVVAPSSAADAKGLLKSAIRSPDPVVFLENELLYGTKGEVPKGTDWTLPLGQARIVRRGRDITLTAFSLMVTRALEAAEALAAFGIEAEVIDLRTLRPLDRATVAESVRRTGRLVAIEEGWPFAGIGAEIMALAVEEAFDWLDAPPARVASLDVPMPYAANLEALVIPQTERIIATVRGLLGR